MPVPRQPEGRYGRNCHRRKLPWCKGRPVGFGDQTSDHRAACVLEPRVHLRGGGPAFIMLRPLPDLCQPSTTACHQLQSGHCHSVRGSGALAWCATQRADRARSHPGRTPEWPRSRHPRSAPGSDHLAARGETPPTCAAAGTRSRRLPQSSPAVSLRTTPALAPPPLTMRRRTGAFILVLALLPALGGAGSIV